MLFASAAASASNNGPVGAAERAAVAQPAEFTIEGPTERPFLMIPFVGNPPMETLGITVRNTGAHTSSLVLPVLTGANSDEFTVTTTCTKIRRGETCLVSVRFRPVTPGAKTALLKIGQSKTTISATSVVEQPLPTYQPGSVLVHFDRHVIDDMKAATRQLTDPMLA